MYSTNLRLVSMIEILIGSLFMILCLSERKDWASWSKSLFGLLTAFLFIFILVGGCYILGYTIREFLK